MIKPVTCQRRCRVNLNLLAPAQFLSCGLPTSLPLPTVRSTCLRTTATLHCATTHFPTVSTPDCLLLAAMPLSAKQMEYLALAVSPWDHCKLSCILHQPANAQQQWQCFETEPKVHAVTFHSILSQHPRHSNNKLTPKRYPDRLQQVRRRRRPQDPRLCPRAHARHQKQAERRVRASHPGVYTPSKLETIPLTKSTSPGTALSPPACKPVTAPRPLRRQPRTAPPRRRLLPRLLRGRGRGNRRKSRWDPRRLMTMRRVLLGRRRRPHLLRMGPSARR